MIGQSGLVDVKLGVHRGMRPPPRGYRIHEFHKETANFTKAVRDSS
jgi:hypothetical protein